MPSVEMALEEMKSLVDELNAHTGWTKVKNVSFFGNLGCAMVAPFAPIVTAVGQYWSQSKIPEQVSQDRQDASLAAALVSSAQAGLA